ncbi:MAG TPA: hypothetical protein VLV83_10610 [Acidobacteriota bacterium]|nr:hypothetical protein [Acidobacteriota bacterium]
MHVGRSALPGAAASESGGSRQYSFRLLDASEEGLAASAAGRRSATIVRATSSQAVLDLDGRRIEIDGPLGGRPGKRVGVRIRSTDPPVIEVFPGRASSAAPGGSSRSETGRTGAAQASATGRVEARPLGASPNLPASAVVISQSRSILLAGIQEQGPYPVQPGESIPLRILASDSTHSLLALRGRPLLLEVGGLPSGHSLWAEVVSGPEYPVLRLRLEGEVAAAAQAHRSRGPATQASESSSPHSSTEAAVQSGQGTARPATARPATAPSSNAPSGTHPDSGRDAPAQALAPTAAQASESGEAGQAAPGADSRVGQRILRDSAISQQAIVAAAAKALAEASDQGLLRAGEFPTLPRGTLLTARVLRHLGPGRSLLVSHGVRFLAQVPRGTAEGEKLLLQVQSREPRTLLSVVDRAAHFESAVTAILRDRLALKLPMGESLARLASQLKALPEEIAAQGHLQRLQSRLLELAGQGRPLSPSRLAEMVDEGGLQYESKLSRAVLAGRPEALQQISQSDLKALLLDTLQRTQGSPQGPLARLAGGVARHLANIESGQAANLLSLSQGQGLQLELPLALGSQLATLRLSVRPDGRQEKPSAPGGRGYHIVFLLRFDSLGETRVDAYSTDEALRADLYVERSQALKSLQNELPGLQDRLRQSGFEQVHLRVRWLKEASEPVQKSFEALGEEKSSGPSVRLIDVRA